MKAHHVRVLGLLPGCQEQKWKPISCGFICVRVLAEAKNLQVSQGVQYGRLLAQRTAFIFLDARYLVGLRLQNHVVDGT